MSIVEYFPEHSGTRCGYCRGKNGSYSHGMWGHVLTCSDYQSLIDRGWRRSGRYCYKPTMDETCCPQYTIKCDVTKFTLTKSQKKILKRFRNFVINGETPTATNPETSTDHQTGIAFRNTNSDDSDQDITDEDLDDDEEIGMDVDSVNQNRAESLEGKLKFVSSQTSETTKTTKKSDSSSSPAKNSSVSSATETDNGTGSIDPKAAQSSSKVTTPKAGMGADPNKPKARKKKEIRKEKALAKLMAASSGSAEQNPAAEDKKFVKPKQHQQKHMSSSSSKKNNEPKTIEDLTSLEFPPHAKHKFEIRLVNAQTSDATFKDSYMDSYNVYKKYQMVIHKDPPSKCTVGQYKRFLCDSSLKSNNSPNETYRHGAFHQQYIMDGKIIAVGVVDILPSCVSSVYLCYDPDYAFLSPGTLTSLFEITFTRKLQKETFPNLTNYYMGYYIHSCSKMRYKAKYSPSCLLCPVTYQWVPVEDALPLLDKSKFATLSQDTTNSPAVLDASGQKSKLAVVSCDISMGTCTGCFAIVRQV